MKRILIVMPTSALIALDPLLRCYHRKYQVTHVDVGSALPDWNLLTELIQDQDVLLLIGSRQYSPRTALPGPFIFRKDGSAVPCAWVPYTSDQALNTFAVNAAKVHARRQSETISPVALLGQWNRKYLNLVDRIKWLLEEKRPGIPIFHWTCDYLIREDMVEGLATGLAAALYVGHGRPSGWVGYRGTRAHHFESPDGKSIAALFSFCCETASRRNIGLSFSEALPLLGKASACFGAVDKTEHRDNARWAVGVADAIQNNYDTVADVLLKAKPSANCSVDHYRLLGDPLAPLVADDQAIKQALKIGQVTRYPDYEEYEEYEDYENREEAFA